MSHIEDFNIKWRRAEMPMYPNVDAAEKLKELYEKARSASDAFRWNNTSDIKQKINSFMANVPEKTIYAERPLFLPDKSYTELFFLSQIKDFPDKYWEEEASCDNGNFYAINSISCLRDERRTKKFLAGLEESVQKLSKSREEIHICDAGCGAIPIFSIYAALSSTKVRATGLELHHDSVEIATKLIHALGLENRVNIVEFDATKYEPDRQFDLLISETMGSALTREPFVQIMNNLASYVKSDGIILPNRVLVKVGTISVDDFFFGPTGYFKTGNLIGHYKRPDGMPIPKSQYVIIGDDVACYHELNWNSVAEFQPGDELEKISFTVQNPADVSTDYLVILASEVDIGNQHLDLYDSFITIPQSLRYPEEVIKTLKYRRGPIKVEYMPGEKIENIAVCDCVETA